jgi:hypothetical protein
VASRRVRVPEFKPSFMQKVIGAVWPSYVEGLGDIIMPRRPEAIGRPVHSVIPAAQEDVYLEPFQKAADQITNARAVEAAKAAEL